MCGFLYLDICSFPSLSDTRAYSSVFVRGFKGRKGQRHQTRRMKVKIKYKAYLKVVLYEGHFVPPPPVYLDPPPMDLGRFEISKGPSNGGGLALGLFEKSNRPSRRGGLDCGLFRRSNRPSKRVKTPQKSLMNPLKHTFFAYSLRFWRVSWNF